MQQSPYAMRRTPWILSLTLHASLVGWGLGVALLTRPAPPRVVEFHIAPSRPSPAATAAPPDARPEPPPEPTAAECTPDPTTIEPPPREFELDPRPDRARIPDPPSPLAEVATVELVLPKPRETTEQQPEAPQDRPTEETPAQSAESAPAPWVEAVAASDNLPPDYPTRARRRGIEGEVLLRLHLTVDGGVEQVEILSASSRLLARAAAAAAWRWSYRPALEHGEPVASVLDVPVVFRLDG